MDIGGVDQIDAKLALEGSPRAAARATGFSELAIGGADAETASALDWDNRDSFDRVLVAHCLNRDLALVTADASGRATTSPSCGLGFGRS
jgi:PIN domain nuclease of toxin-antitoxin system